MAETERAAHYLYKAEEVRTTAEATAYSEPRRFRMPLAADYDMLPLDKRRYACLIRSRPANDLFAHVRAHKKALRSPLLRPFFRPTCRPSDACPARQDAWFGEFVAVAKEINVSAVRVRVRAV